MQVSQKRSVSVPAETEVARLMFEAARRAEAMGIVEPDVARLDPDAIRHLAGQVRSAGIATSAADVLRNVAQPSRQDVVALLEMIIAALEASPAPRFEWKGVARVFPVDDLAALLGVSVSSLKRYESGDRDTPDEVAARLHFLALVIGDLAGSYNDIGIRRWFQRKRSQLDARSPAAILAGSWDPDAAGPQRVRQLARNLVALSGT
jgi:transcriptional regulator with XRE-family HTH domain